MENEEILTLQLTPSEASLLLRALARFRDHYAAQAWGNTTALGRIAAKVVLDCEALLDKISTL